MISSLCANSNFNIFPKNHKSFHTILGVFSFSLEAVFYKAKCTSITGISTRHSLTTDNIGQSKHLHFRKMSQLVHSSSSPRVAHSDCRAGRSSRLTWRNGQGAGGSAGFSSLRAPYLPGEPEAPKMSYMFFSSNTATNGVLKTASQILWWLQ